MTAALEIESLAADVGGRPVLEDVSLSVAAGEVVGVLGRNGAGKTTLLKAAVGLLPPRAGQVRLAGHDLAAMRDIERASLVGYLPQERRIAWDLAAWRIAALGAVDRPPAAAKVAALDALARVNLSALAARGALSMSGGERARVLLARFLATRAPLLVADEAIAGLDVEAQLLALDLLREEAGAGRAVLASLHDLALAARACDRVIVLDRGRIVAEGPPLEALTPAVLSEAFGVTGELASTPRGAVLFAHRGSGAHP
jgi:iron complex transport system ATP-binding protein